jgi:sugar O-acyltransferase (sialic acid O-acetyltransferase NeuD family)
MKNSSLILIGAGGHARSCIDVVEDYGQFKIEGLVGLKDQINTKQNGYPVIGIDDQLTEFAKKYHNALITIGQVKTPKHRIRLFKKAKKLGFNMPTIISPRAYVSRFAKIGEGTIVMHGAIINAGAIIGSNCIINSRALIEHDVKIQDNCHISTGSILNGGVKVNSGSFIGSASFVKENISIGANCLVGMGNNVRRNISDNTLFLG